MTPYQTASNQNPFARRPVAQIPITDDTVNGRIEARGLVKRYGSVTALDGVDLVVEEGSVLGLLGPNGAGKTTAVSILTTLLQADGGEATVAGADIATAPTDVRRRIGLSGQYAAVDENLTGYENLDMIGRLYHLGRRRAGSRARELLERFSLADAGDRLVKTYSGGMRRRLDLAGALVAEPPVLFLDEPTTGLDPRSRNELWDVIEELVDRGRTVLLTTQYMEEAELLADNIVVIDQGTRIAHGTVDELKAIVGGERIDIAVPAGGDAQSVARVLARFALDEPRIDGRSISAPIAGGPATLTRALRAFDDERVALGDVSLRRPTLDDVFLTLTGRAAATPVHRNDTPTPDHDQDHDQPSNDLKEVA